MAKKRQKKGNGGFTLVELMIASGVFAISLVALLGGVVQVTTHNDMANNRAQANMFNRNTLETLRGLGADDVLAYQIPLDNPEMGTVNIPGFGEAIPTMFAMIPNAQGGVDLFELGVDDPATVPDPPNPMEVQISLVKFDPHTMYNPDTGERTVPTYHENYTTSTKIGF